MIPRSPYYCYYSRVERGRLQCQCTSHSAQIDKSTDINDAASHSFTNQVLSYLVVAVVFAEELPLGRPGHTCTQKNHICPLHNSNGALGGSLVDRPFRIPVDG